MKTETKPTHTPTPPLYAPWKCDEDGEVTNAAILHDLREVGNFGKRFGDALVRAVNSHEELLKLAKIYHQIQINRSGHIDARECCYAAEVIAQAEGK